MDLLSPAARRHQWQSHFPRMRSLHIHLITSKPLEAFPYLKTLRFICVTAKLDSLSPIHRFSRPHIHPRFLNIFSYLSPISPEPCRILNISVSLLQNTFALDRTGETNLPVGEGSGHHLTGHYQWEGHVGKISSLSSAKRESTELQTPSVQNGPAILPSHTHTMAQSHGILWLTL